MRIVGFESAPFHALRYSLSLSAGSSTALLPFHRATVEGLPAMLDCIIATADLQGIVQSADAGPILLGEALASELEALRARGEVDSKDRTAAFLAGDFHANADEADVRRVWLAVLRACRWVAGVAGNHDAFAPGTFEQGSAHILDEKTVKLDGILIAGISGIVGTKQGKGMRAPDTFASAIARLARQGVDVLLCHDGPNVSGTDLAGWPCVRQVLERCQPTLVVRGHDAWRTPLATLANGTQVLNVEGRVMLLCRAA